MINDRLKLQPQLCQNGINFLLTKKINASLTRMKKVQNLKKPFGSKNFKNLFGSKNFDAVSNRKRIALILN